MKRVFVHFGFNIRSPYLNTHHRVVFDLKMQLPFFPVPFYRYIAVLVAGN